MACTLATSGVTVLTAAPRARTDSASAEASVMLARRAPGHDEPAVGTRQSTRAPRPAGAASRFVGLHTPPSTYSRPAISTGANTHGMAHEASTACATWACGASG